MLDRLNTTEVFAGTTKLSSFEQEVFSRARAASEGLRRTFDAWIDIGKAVQIARRHADAGGGSPKVRNARFREILDEQQLGWLGARNRSTEVAQLLAIMSRLKEVQKWRASLPEHSRDRWQSPQSVWKRSGIFHPDGRTKGPVVRPKVKLLHLSGEAAAQLIYDRYPAKAWALRRALDELLDGGTAPRPKSGWATAREREHAASAAA